MMAAGLQVTTNSVNFKPKVETTDLEFNRTLAPHFSITL
jgi:hypothetical protein